MLVMQGVLTFIGILLILGNSRITDTAVRSLVKCCPELRRIHLVDCERLTDLSLKALSQSKNLVVVNVADCIRFDISCLFSLFVCFT